MDARAELTGVLFSTVGRFRRQVRRSAGRSFAAGLTESQAELLRLVGRRPGISVSAAAAELGLAANTASTLVSRLVADELLVRTPDRADRRVGRLHLTEPAQRLADVSRAARRAAMAEVIDQLDDREIATLTAGMEVLTKMTHLLAKRAP
ncbi:MarR family winged helix-turn-helix transcriptional regulator [Mycolicibacterium tokaiense]|uniref:Transcriptional regulator, MarR family n=1 Tax=Mycolicibacterium tokaiense TaxID=39695 RepID=A0A378TIR4_9MYCO|nr:MarR family transcriptional regulator [Mycolicibacterium tokaiense]BBY85443.1 MarR family transcriptional regulator [Mycolicibacterium tokaiense]STZ60047.1 Transcriptional regulator, MarR family [Mycolicibacterium tokaiense]